MAGGEKAAKNGHASPGPSLCSAAGRNAFRRSPENLPDLLRHRIETLRAAQALSGVGEEIPEGCPVAFSFATAWFRFTPILRTIPDARISSRTAASAAYAPRSPQTPGRQPGHPGARSSWSAASGRPGRAPVHPCAVTPDQLHRQGDGLRAAGTTNRDASAPRQSRKTLSAALCR
jgi:hypothetical protein